MVCPLYTTKPDAERSGAPRFCGKGFAKDAVPWYNNLFRTIKWRGADLVFKSAEGTYNYLKALWHIQKSLVCALIYTTSTPLEIGFDIANSWEYYSAFAGYSHLHIIKAACGLTGAPLSDFTINLISQVSTNITGIHGLVRRVGSDSFPPYFFSAKKMGAYLQKVAPIIHPQKFIR